MMARLECTVAHMGFPAATLNKRIKKKKSQFGFVREAEQSSIIFTGTICVHKVPW
jgi:hypothetical protein